MAFIVKDQRKPFVPAPAGTQQAVCCDVVDLGEIDGKFGPKPTVELRWLTAEVNDEGKPFLVRERYAVFFNEKANLRKAVQSWLGRNLTEAEVKDGFDLEWFIHKNCLLNLVHSKPTEKGVYANVKGVMPLAKGMNIIEVPSDYVRVKDRPTNG